MARKKKKKKKKKNRPIKFRGDWGAINPVTRKTPTRIEKERRSEKKHKKQTLMGGELNE